MREKFLKYNNDLLLFFLWLSVIGIFTTDYFRALLSIAMIGFTLVGLLSAKPKNWFKNLLNSKSLLALIISSFATCKQPIICPKHSTFLLQEV